MTEGASDYSGMTTNERLFVAGLLDAFDTAIEQNERQDAVAVLGEVDLADQAEWIVDLIFANPAKYGFPRS